jgi:hypothetical protein
MRFGVLLVMCVACGDDVPREVPFDATSGTRLRVERYLFDDGTTLPAATGFFDTDLHVRCTAQTWVDGVTRCVADAEDALFKDPTCMTAVGRGMRITKPHVFVGHDVVDGVALPSHIYRAADPVTAPGQYWQQIDGACTGPFFTPSDYTYYAIESEASPPVELSETTVGDGRLALRVRKSTDGAATPLAVFDRELQTDCEPSARTGDQGVCEPIGAAIASYFADAECTQPAVAISMSVSPQPLVARIDHPGACSTYHALGADLASTIYRLDRGNCFAIVRDPSVHYLPLVDEAALPAIERTAEESPRRLHRLRIADDDLLAYGDRVIDTAIDGECARVLLGDVERCMPTSTLTALDMFAPGCAQRVRVTQVPTSACQTPEFAASFTDHIELSAIGDATTEIVYRPAADGTCKPYSPPAGYELRALGPPLPDDTFLAVHPFGER